MTEGLEELYNEELFYFNLLPNINRSTQRKIDVPLLYIGIDLPFSILLRLSRIFCCSILFAQIYVGLQVFRYGTVFYVFLKMYFGSFHSMRNVVLI
jgi:hypothetical protein